MRRTTWKRIAPYAALSIIAFLFGIGLLILMLWNAERLVALGLVGNCYYIVLLPLGLFAATSLFGVLESCAKYSGKVLGGNLVLGGPIVVFCLVVIGGFYLPKSSESFDVTVLVHGEKGAHDLVLRRIGRVWMTLDGDRRREEIDDKGQTEFKNIPAPFRGKNVPISIEAEGFETSVQNYPLTGQSVSVMARRVIQTVSGRTIDSEGRPVAGAIVSVGTFSSQTDANGHFFLELGREHQDSIEALISAFGYASWRGKLTANGGGGTIQLRRGE